MYSIDIGCTSSSTFWRKTVAEIVTMAASAKPSSVPIPVDIDVPVVEYWEEVYQPKYAGDCTTDTVLSPVDHKALYTALDSLIIKVTGETTGVDGTEWFKLLEAPDYRSPFPDMVKVMLKPT